MDDKTQSLIDQRKLVSVSISKLYYASIEGDILFIDDSGQRVLKPSRKGEVQILNCKGEFISYNVRDAIGKIFLPGKSKSKDKILELVSRDGNLKNTAASNLYYTPKIKKILKRVNNKYVCKVEYLGRLTHLGTFGSKAAAEERVDETIQSLKSYNEWEETPFTGCVLSLSRCPY